MSDAKTEKLAKSITDDGSPDAAMAKKAGQEKRAEKRKEKRERAGEELAQELEGLRETLSDMVESYRLKVEGQLAEIAAAARGTTRFGGDSTALRLSVAEKMLGRIRKMELKPKKGRAKDFQRLETLVEELAALLPAAK